MISAEPAAIAARQPSRARAQLERRSAPAVSSMYIGASFKLGPARSRARSQSSSLSVPVRNLVLVEAADRADHAHRQLRSPPISMLNTATGMLRLQRDVLADVQGERRLAHARPAGDDDRDRLPAGPRSCDRDRRSPLATPVTSDGLSRL